ncbi:MAG: MobA/MobL family protein, partial [Acidobacteriota bacterium]|nr:MobA/MobL family protein [Acidobacteriota bacterium]
MAIYHLTVKNGSRAGGQSASAHACYIAREGKYGRPDRDGADRDPLLYSESAHMPAWAAGDPLAYWEAADTYERANGQLYKEVEFALPAELSAAEQQAAASAFAQALTAAEQLPYSLAIHAGQGTNPHCHLMISERANDGIEREADEWFKRANRAEPERGGALKTRTLQTKDWLLTTREAWAAEANQALERAGEPERIDHRSYADQGIEREPGVYVNAAVRAMEARGIETDRGNAAREVAAAARQLDELAAQEAALLEERASLIAAAAIAASPVPPSRWETVKERVGAWLSQDPAPESEPDPPAAQRAPSAAQDGPAPSPPASDQAEAAHAPQERVFVA